MSLTTDAASAPFPPGLPVADVVAATWTPMPTATALAPTGAAPSHAPRRPALEVDEPLPMPLASWGVPEARLALDEARLACHVPLAPVTLISALTTVVFRCGDHAVKVYPPGTDPGHLARLATALTGSASALLPIAPPIVTSWGVATLTPWVGVAPRRGPAPTPAAGWAGTGALLRAFHAEHLDADVPVWDPLRRVVTQTRDLPDAAAAVLLDARGTLLEELARLRSPLGVGVVHGDVSPSNVLAGPGGPVLIDLDFAARAPLEYDLSSAARRADAGEIDAVTYLAFCRAYGHDVRTWDGRVVLDAIAALGGVAFRIWDDRRAGRELTWLDGAVARWRTPL
ncbi:phosphotransferase [Georgenia faecalis]|uniref:Phosphotransferase n=1 Tax=Georgenia faecalis TaxID=2483799 RepID=A0ABV9DC06_9MICO|nr:phosphotransferase [Georgenia faecalis]